MYGGSNNWDVKGGDSRTEAGNQRKTEAYSVRPLFWSEY